MRSESLGHGFMALGAPDPDRDLILDDISEMESATDPINPHISEEDLEDATKDEKHSSVIDIVEYFKNKQRKELAIANPKLAQAITAYTKYENFEEKMRAIGNVINRAA